MPTSSRSTPFLLATCAALFLTACPSPPAPSYNTQPTGATSSTPTPQPVKSTCDCSIFPPKAGCDSQCGITTGVVEQVTANSVTISVPSIKASESGKRTTQVLQRTFAISPAESKQLESIRPGSRVALTFHQESGQSVMKSIRQIPLEPAR